MTVDHDEVVTQEGRIHEINMNDWAARVRAFLLYGDPSQKMLVSEGEAGCGKSEVTAQVCRDLGLPPIICPGLGAQQMEEFLALTRLDTDDDGIGRVVQGVLENIIPTPRMSKDPKYKLANGKVVIPWLIDECFTGAMGQMNQLRAALTFRKIGSVELPPETYIIGTTNPETVEYSSRKTVDAAVMDRCAVFHVYMDFEMHMRYLAKLAKKGRYPEVCRMFLRMPENMSLWKAASPRFWHTQFGLTWKELDSDPGIDEDTKTTLFRSELENHFQLLEHRAKMKGKEKGFPMTATALVARFAVFIEHGDDPKYYPISANHVLDANAKQMKEHLALFDYWRSEGQQNFIGVTIQDLTSTVCALGDDDKFGDPHVKHVASLLDKSGGGLATQFCGEIFRKTNKTGAEHFNRITKALKNKKVFAEVVEAMEKHDTMVRKMKKEREEGKLVKKED